MTQVKISVILPAYKTPEPLLKRAMDNILNDIITDIELIIINDGADLSVKNTIDKYNDKRIKYLETPKAHGGPSKARNLALKYAEGEYLFFHDHDDFLYSKGYTKSALERMYKSAKMQNADILFFDIINGKRPDADFNFHSFDLAHEQSFEELIKKEDKQTVAQQYAIYFKEGMFSLWNKLIRKSLLTDNNIYFNEKLVATDDMDLFFRIIFLAEKIAQTNEICYYYDNANDYSITNKMIYENEIYYKDAVSIAYIKKTLENYGIFEDLKIPLANNLLKTWRLSPLFRYENISSIKVKKYIRKYIKMLEISEKDFDQLDGVSQFAFLYFV